MPQWEYCYLQYTDEETPIMLTYCYPTGPDRQTFAESGVSPADTLTTIAARLGNDHWELANVVWTPGTPETWFFKRPR
jgi:hypothetical protein